MVGSYRPGSGRQVTVSVVAVAALLLVAACGPRRPHDEFVAAAGSGGLQPGAVASDGSGATGPGGTDGFADGSLGADGTGSGSTGSGSTRSGSTRSGSTGSGSTGSGSTGSGQNTASDVGVTPDSILLGNITSVNGALGPNVFTPGYYGASAFFQDLNAKGGVNGREVKFATCDDKEDPNLNLQCANSFIEGQKVFALVGSTTRVGSASAGYINGKGVPSMDAVSIGNWASKYPHMWGNGGRYPRDGKNVGVDGKLYSQDGPFKWLHDNLGVSKAAVFFYSIAISRQAGLQYADALRRQGIEVVYYGGGSDQGMNPAAPTFDSDVIQMQSRGVDMIINTIDMNGFQKLCQSMDRYDFTVKANVGNVQAFGDVVGDFSAPCRNSVSAFTVSSRSYSDVGHPQIQQIRAAVKKYYPDAQLHQWMVDGWVAARRFTEAMAAQGANLTRAGVERSLSALRDDTLGGLTPPVDYRWPFDYSKPAPNCFTFARWQESAATMMTLAPITTCLTMPFVSYTPIDDGS